MEDIFKLKEVLELLRYDKETGNLIWLKPRGSRARPGDSAGRIDPNGGVKEMSLLGHKVPVRNIVWLINRGRMPSGVIVHVDHDPCNTKIENLRNLSRSDAKLYSIYKDSKPGVYKTSNGLYVVIIEKEGKPFFVGSVGSIEEAVKAKRQFDIPERKLRGSQKKEYCVYGHFKPGERLPFYVGKGRVSRARDFNSRNPRYREVLRDLELRGQVPIARLTRDLLTEKQALKLERGLILKIGFEQLTNGTIGGEGLEKFSYSQDELKVIEELLW